MGAASGVECERGPAAAQRPASFEGRVVEQIGGLTFACAPRGKILYASRGLQRATGHSVAQLVKSSWLELLHPADRERLVGWESAADLRLRYVSECRLRSPDGSFRWSTAVLRGVRSHSDGIVGWKGTFTAPATTPGADVRDVQSEVSIAREFQLAALPNALPRIPGIRLDVAYRAGAYELTVGGDWYDAFTLPDGSLALTVGDVGGSGLRAALLMSELRHGIRALGTALADPAAIAFHVDAVLRSAHAGCYATAFFGIYDPAARALRYVLCGHPPPLLRTAGGAVLELGGDAHAPLGILDLVPALTISSQPIEPGSLLLCYTDGVIEADHDALAGTAALCEAVAQRSPEGSAEALVDALLGAEAEDDIVVLAVRFGD